jgi:hypothetical protein
MSWRHCHCAGADDLLALGRRFDGPAEELFQSMPAQTPAPVSTITLQRIISSALSPAASRRRARGLRHALRGGSRHPGDAVLEFDQHGVAARTGLVAVSVTLSISLP